MSESSGNRQAREPNRQTALSSADLLRVNPGWKKLPIFERKRWKRLPFAAFAESINERVEPADAADDIYVGLDDLDSCDLQIRRWGKGSDVIGTKLRFRKGDIIFGRRRAYQRKLAVAEMDGICSAHAMVVRAKPEVVLPQFLPFLMMSDRFMNRAVEISVGSLSPTINWATLKLEEFDLPPLDQQRRIAGVLWAANSQKQSMEATLVSFQTAYDAFSNEQFANVNGCSIKMGELTRHSQLDIQTGPFGTVLQASSYVKSGTPIVNPVNMRSHRLWVNEGPFLDDHECERLVRYKMKVGDILIGRKGDVGRAVFVTPEYDGYIVGSDLIRLRLTNSELRPEYLYHFMLAPCTRTWITRHASGTTMPGINEKLINNIEISIPPPTKQTQVLSAVRQMNQAGDALAESVAASRDLVLLLANHLTALRPLGDS